MLDLLLSSDPNSDIRLRFSGLIREWDNVKESDWTDGTARNTATPYANALIDPDDPADLFPKDFFISLGGWQRRPQTAPSIELTPDVARVMAFFPLAT